jgi:hypothetical protein
LDRRRRYINNNRGGKRPSNIIPIIWHPARKPRAVPDFETQFAPELDPKDYGVWDLLDQRKEDEFRKVVNGIALSIRNATRTTPLPDPGYPPVFGGLTSAFQPELPLVSFDAAEARKGPETVTFVYATDAAWQSWPSPPPEAEAETALNVSASVAAGFEFETQELRFDPQKDDLIARLSDAYERNNLVVLLVEGNSLSDRLIQKRLREFDQEDFEGFSTMVIWSSQQHFDEASVQNVFPRLYRHRSPFFFPRIDSSESLAKALSRTLQALQAIVLKRPNHPNPLPSTSRFASLPPLLVPGSQVGG